MTHAADAAAPPPTAEDARARAHEILQQQKFSTNPEPPGPLDRLGKKVGEWLRDLMPSTSRTFTLDSGAGGLLEGLVWLVLFVVLIVVAVMLVRTVRRRGRVPEGDDDDVEPSEAADDLEAFEYERDPGVLERAAEAAVAEGDYDRAVRLRFRAGLLRLDEAGALEFRPSLTSGQVVGAVRTAPSLRGVARQFDAVAYGDRHAGPADCDAASEGWTRVLTEVGR